MKKMKQKGLKKEVEDSSMGVDAIDVEVEVDAHSSPSYRL